MDANSLRRLWPLAVVALLLAVTAVAAGHSSLEFSRVEPTVDNDVVPGLPDYSQERELPSFPPEPSAVAPAEPTELPDWLAPLAATLCVLAVVVAVGLLVWAMLRDRLGRRTRRVRPDAPRRAAGRTAEEVVAAVDAGLVDLSDADADPRRAVIACWLRLEQAAAAAGVRREVGDTPTDLVTRLLSGNRGVSADVLGPFATVYREARYATRTVDERMRTQARAALQRLRGELTTEVKP
ncbi:DUF4129 domain-containing protein [Polymorphospora sp. NPDC050346]|uniref:DUF4129 domain-containing protein n=1 Tax=Polymorphospora sp. NPDC050346 TaxID=3155780 RepID=UPI0033DA9F1C